MCGRAILGSSKDSDGRIWGWANNASCAFRDALGPPCRAIITAIGASWKNDQPPIHTATPSPSLEPASKTAFYRYVAVVLVWLCSMQNLGGVTMPYTLQTCGGLSKLVWPCRLRESSLCLAPCRCVLISARLCGHARWWVAQLEWEALCMGQSRGGAGAQQSRLNRGLHLPFTCSPAVQELEDARQGCPNQNTGASAAVSVRTACSLLLNGDAALPLFEAVGSGRSCCIVNPISLID